MQILQSHYERLGDVYYVSEGHDFDDDWKEGRVNIYCNCAADLYEDEVLDKVINDSVYGRLRIAIQSSDGLVGGLLK